MTDHERELLTRARTLEETDELAETLAQILAGAGAAGADPAAVASLQAAISVLDPGQDTGYDPGGPGERRTGGGFGSDAEFIEALHDAEGELRERLRAVERLQEEVIVALDAAQEALEAARAMPVRDPCDGCHGARDAAIAAAQARIELCDRTIEILDPLAQRLRAALEQLVQVPGQLGEVYELVYAFVSKGGRMPAWGRWIKGEEEGA